jgi:predicted small lipoprotein YifL
MLRDFIARFRMVAAAFAAAVGLATLFACGVKGPLKPPPAPAAAAATTSPDSRPASSIESPAASPPKTQETRP